MRKLAIKHGYSFAEKDGDGLIELVKGSGIQPRFKLLDGRNIFNIISTKDVWKHQSIYLFDIRTGSTFYPVRTVLLIKSTEFSFPYISIQPALDAISPGQSIRRLIRNRPVVQREIQNVRPEFFHNVYVEDADHWDVVAPVLMPLIKEEPGAFLETENFYFYYSPEGDQVFTTKLQKLIELGLDLCEKISQQ